MTQTTIGTSADNPLRIATLSAGAGGGAIGITFAPGKQQADALSGVHRRDLAADLDVIAVWNAAVVITLVEQHELDALGIARLGTEVRRRHMEWHHWPIQDFGTPDAVFAEAWPARSASLRSLLACGARVLIHCKGGLGRAGMITARLLVDTGVAPATAIAAVRAARPGAIETEAQERWVAASTATPPPLPRNSQDAARDRAIGSLLGLAVGDALGAAIEFQPKPRFAPLDDMVSGGPHRLERGQWTDDTAMALALADSLLETPELDASDLMRRFLDWRETGSYSCTGTCFDIGNQISAALGRFRRDGNPLAGSTEPQASGNGALMCLAPVSIRHWRDRDSLRQAADLQTRTTHGSPSTIATSRTLATMLADAIAGTSLREVLASTVADAIEGGWRGLHRDAIAGTGWVVRSLQAAVWAVSRTTNFRSAVLLAANLGEDADTTAAIAGQLAGAVYGTAGIPADWLAALAWQERIEDTAGRLFDAGSREVPDRPSDRQVDEDQTIKTGDQFAVFGTTQDWTLSERLRALAAFQTVFDRDGFVFSEQVPSRTEDGLIVLGGTALGEDSERFYQTLYDYGWIRVFDWAEWRGTERGNSLMHDAEAIAIAGEDDLARVLTTCVRADRFCEGYLSDAFEAGLIGRVVARAGQLLATLEANSESAADGEPAQSLSVDAEALPVQALRSDAEVRTVSHQSANRLNVDSIHAPRVERNQQMRRRDGAPLWISEGQISTPLQRTDLKMTSASLHYDEAWLQKLIHNHPEVLPTNQIEPGFGDLISVCRELEVSFGGERSGFLDNFFITSAGRLVLVEAKLWRNPEARRAVIAQAMEYAAAVFKLTYSELERAVLKARKAMGLPSETLFELARAQTASVDEAEFIDAVTVNLRQGRAIVAVVGDGIREDIMPLASLLQSHAGSRFTFALVELAIYDSPQSGVRIVVPSVLAETVLIERGVVRLENSTAQNIRIDSVEPTRSFSAGRAKRIGLSEDEFYERLRLAQPDLPAKVKSFVEDVSEFDVYTEFRGALNLKHTSVEGQPLNLGVITKEGHLDTEPSTWWERRPFGDAYNSTLATAIGGVVKISEDGQRSSVRTTAGKMPQISDLLPKHEQLWLDAVETYVEAYMASTAISNSNGQDV